MESIVALLVIAVFGGGFFFLISSAKRRGQEFKDAALMMGFQYTSKGDGTVYNEFSKNTGIMTKEAVREAHLFTRDSGSVFEAVINGYYYGSSRAHYDGYTMFCFRSVKLCLPEFIYLPGSGAIVDMTVKMLGRKKGYEKVRFDGDPEFQKKSTVVSNNAEAVRGLFSRACFRGVDDAKGLMKIEGQGDKFIITFGRAFKPQDLATKMENMRKVYAMFAQ